MTPSRNVGKCTKTKKRRNLTNDETIVDITSYVLLNRRILNFVGLYPKNGTRSSTVAFFILLIVVPQVLQIYQSRDLNVILETSSILLMIILALLKIIAWSVKRNEINDLITYMLSDYWNMINFENEASSGFLRYATFSKAFTKCYVLLVINALVLFSGFPLIQMTISKIKGFPNATRALSFPGLYPEGWMESPFYEITLLSQIISSCSAATVLLAIDTLVAMALFHTCGHLKIVQKNLCNLEDDVKDTVNPIDTGRREESLKILARQKLVDYIKHHQVILRFSETVERLFSPIMLCQVLVSVMDICLVGLQVSLNLADHGKLPKFLAHLLTALFQLILFCLPGDDLINQSLAVSDAAYATNWYKNSKLLESDVRFMILRSQKPAKITAGKFTVMCLEHFGAVLSTSMSYFAVLRSFS